MGMSQHTDASKNPKAWAGSRHTDTSKNMYILKWVELDHDLLLGRRLKHSAGFIGRLRSATDQAVFCWFVAGVKCPERCEVWVEAVSYTHLTLPTSSYV